MPDGIGIRNYLYSEFIVKLTEAGNQLTILHNLDRSLIESVKSRLNVDFEQIQFKVFPESKWQLILREATTYARLRLSAKRVNNPTLLNNWARTKKGFKKVLTATFAEFLGKSLKKYENILFMESEIYRFWKKSPAFHYYNELLKAQEPDLIFITHQRVPSLVPLCLAAKSLKIKTLTAIYSWDNIPKARLPIRTDYYAVWSEYMKKELMDFYPEISESQIELTGTPQFDFYQNQELIISRKDFADKYKLDSDKKWILFSGDDLLTSPYDPEYLRDVAESVLDHPEIQVLFRQVPVNSHDRYLKYIEKYSNITHIPPLWKRGESWMSFFPLFEDIQLLMNLCYHCETVVNIGSTMALDFSFFGKPGIYIDYDTQENPHWSTKIIYQFQHFRTMEGLDAVIFAKSKDDLKAKILKAIQNPQSVAVDREAWKKRITLPGRKASDNILESVLALLPKK